MTELCKDLSLSIYKEADPQEKGQERVRVRINNPLEMMEVIVCQQINVSTHQSRRYHIKEAVVIVLRKAVSEAFNQGMISDSLGSWTISRPEVKGPSSTKSEIELDF